MNWISSVCFFLLFLFLSISPVHAQVQPAYDIDSVAPLLASQPAIGFVRSGTLGIPAPSNLGSSTGSITSNTTSGQSSGTSIGVTARVDKLKLTDSLSLSLAAESAQFFQPSATSTTAASKSMDTVTFQTLGLRLGLGNVYNPDSKYVMSQKREISACCNLKTPAYMPDPADIKRCNDVGIDLTSADPCSASDMLMALSTVISGFSGEFGIRGIFVDAESTSIPGFATELIGTYNHRTFGSFLSASYLNLKEWEQSAGDTIITRLANHEYQANAGLHFNFFPSDKNITKVLRIGIQGAYAKKTWDAISNDRLDSNFWEGSLFISGHFTEGFQGTFKLGATKLMEDDHTLYIISFTPSFGSKLK